MRKSPETLQEHFHKAGASRVGSTQKHMHLKPTRRDWPGGDLSPGVAAKVQMSICTSVGSSGKRKSCVVAMVRISGRSSDFNVCGEVWMACNAEDGGVENERISWAGYRRVYSPNYWLNCEGS